MFYRRIFRRLYICFARRSLCQCADGKHYSAVIRLGLGRRGFGAEIFCAHYVFYSGSYFKRAAYRLEKMRRALWGHFVYNRSGNSIAYSAGFLPDSFSDMIVNALVSFSGGHSVQQL